MSLNFSNPLYVSWQHRVTMHTGPAAAAAYEMNFSIHGESVLYLVVLYYKIMEEEEDKNHLIQELLEKHPT